MDQLKSLGVFDPLNGFKTAVDEIKALPLGKRKRLARATYSLFGLCVLVSAPVWWVLLALLAFWRLVAEPVFSKAEAR